MKFEIKISHLLLILGLIIFLFPALAILPTLPKLSNYFDFSSTGEIGDTIGGVTAPFINAIGAILVYLAFKEQIKANKLIMEQQLFQHTQEQINRLEDEFMNLQTAYDSISLAIIESKRDMSYIGANGKQVYYYIGNTALSKIKYIASTFLTTNIIVEKTIYNKDFLSTKLGLIYQILYRNNFLLITKRLKLLEDMQSDSKYLENSILEDIQELERLFLPKTDVTPTVPQPPNQAQ